MLDESTALLKSQASPSTVNPTAAGLTPYTAFAAIPARYAIDRGAWAEAAALEPQGKTAAAEAITYFTRATASACSGDPPGARKPLEHLQALTDGFGTSQQAPSAEPCSTHRHP